MPFLSSLARSLPSGLSDGPAFDGSIAWYGSYDRRGRLTYAYVLSMCEADRLTDIHISNISCEHF